VSKRDFEPIRITGYNEERTTREKKNNYSIPFCLSDTPPRKWEESFNQLWKSRIKQNSTQKAKAYLRKNQLILDSPLDDVSFHFANLKTDIEAANSQYMEYIQQKNEKISEKKRQRKEKLMAEKQALRDVLDKLTLSDS
jgi:hypothetical protein